MTAPDLAPALAASISHAREAKRQHAKRLGKNMNQAIERVQPGSSGALAAQVVLDGDLSSLSDSQLSTYYIEMCRSLDLNHLTRPFSLLKLNGKLIWYANKDCSDQLRKRDKVSVTIVGREEVSGVLVVTARATLPDGRVDESIGALPIDTLKGEARANALMKCETKAKRRVTLSICGLGMLDESEVEGAQATDNGGHTEITPHGSPDASPAHVDSGEYNRAMEQLKECNKDVFDPGCTWETMNKWHARLGEKGAPGPFGLRLSEMYRGDLPEQQQKALAAAWARVDRKIAALKAKLKPPSVEASFVDEPDGTEALGAAEREPGEEG